MKGSIIYAADVGVHAFLYALSDHQPASVGPTRGIENVTLTHEGPDMTHPITPAYAAAVLRLMASEYEAEIELHHGVANDVNVPADTREHHEESEHIARTRWNTIAFALNLIETNPA